MAEPTVYPITLKVKNSMTEAEYKAWVETGKFPDRLRPMLKGEK